MNVEIQDAAAIPTIIGWCQYVKRMIPETMWKFLPMLSVLMGMVYAFMLKPPGKTVMDAATYGAALGLSASGAFSTVKHTFEKNGKKD